MSSLSGLSGLSGLIDSVIVVVPPASEVQRFYFGEGFLVPSSGTYNLSFDTETTGTINYNDGAAAIKAELEGLSNIGAGNVSVTALGANPIIVGFQINFIGDLSNTNVVQIGANSSLKQVAQTIDVEVIQEGVVGEDIIATNTTTQAALDGSETVNSSSATNIGLAGWINWSNLSNVSSEDGAFAECSLTPGQTSKLLNITFGNTDIPSYATIAGVYAEIKMQKTGSGSITETTFRLLNDVSLCNNYATNGDWSTSLDFEGIGGPTELHGSSFSPSSFNTGLVKLRVQVSCSDDNVVAKVDFARLTVYYNAHQIDTYSFSGLATEGQISFDNRAWSYNSDFMDTWAEYSISGGPQTALVTTWNDYSSHTPITAQSNTLRITDKQHIFSVTLADSPTEGTFTLTVNGDTSNQIDYNSSTGSLEGILSDLGYNASVIGPMGGPWTITSDDYVNWTVSANESVPLLKPLAINVLTITEGHS